MTAMRAHAIAVLFLVAGCTSPATAPDLSLHDRFVLTAMTDGDGQPFDPLLKWTWPIRVRIVGSQDYRDLVVEHLALLSELTGQQVEMDSDWPNMTIEFSSRRAEWYCHFSLNGPTYLFRTTVFISTDQPDRHIRRCIVQELSQSMGFLADTDGRRDTTFSSRIGTDYLTEFDLALFATLYDDRLYSGMPRDRVLAVLPEIVADVEARQDAGR